MGVDSNVYVLVGYKAKNQKEIDYITERDEDLYSNDSVPVSAVLDHYCGDHAYVGYPLACINPRLGDEEVSFYMSEPCFDLDSVADDLWNWYPELDVSLIDIKLYIFPYYT